MRKQGNKAAHYACLVLLTGFGLNPATAALPVVSVPEGSAVVPGRSAAEHYGWATEHLTRGRWFERAAAQLQEAVRQQPENVKYRLALGCAYASRATSIAYAAAFTQRLAGERAGYRQALAEWEAAQKDPEAEEYGEPRPEPPPRFVFPTKDDGRPLRLSVPQAQARAAVLAKSARTEWDKALALAKTDAERAEAQYVRGWGLRLLQRYKDSLFGDEAEEEDEAFEQENRTPEPGPSRQEILKAFETATKLGPDVAVYWQSLGNALEGSRGQDVSAGDKTQAMAAFRRALELAPNNPPLWYHLYQLLAGQASTRRSEEALACLRRVAESDPTNAFPLYLLAEWRFKDAGARYWEINGKVIEKPATREDLIAAVAAAQTGEQRQAGRDAITFMERGNRALRFFVPRYPAAVPKLLAAAWSYYAWVDIPFNHFAQLRELARNATGYALVAAKEGSRRDAVRAARAAIGAGFKIIGDWPLHDSPSEGKTVIAALVGIAVAAIGYANLEKVYQILGDPLSAQRAAAEYAAFKERSKAYREQVMQSLNESRSVYNVY